MRFLIDENLPVSYARLLTNLGFEATHVVNVGLAKTEDVEIVAFAQKHQWAIITFDLDFSRIVSVGKLEFPSIITFRMDSMSGDKFYDIAKRQFPGLEKALKTGSMVTITDRQIRVKKLPVSKN